LILLQVFLAEPKVLELVELAVLVVVELVV